MNKRLVQNTLRVLWMINTFGLSYPQLPMPPTYLPKEYFLPDGTRDPRHLDPSVNPYYTGQSQNPHSPNGNGIVTTTYHLNPRADLAANFELKDNDINPYNTHRYSPSNNNYGPLSLNNNNLNNINNVNNINSNALGNGQFGDKIIASSSTTNGRRSRRRLKLRRLPKSFRPPKEFIIYSLPEQSFWATQEDDPLTPGGTETSSDLDDLGLEDNRTDREGEEDEGKSETDKGTAKSDKNSGEGTTTISSSQKKILLGQCMKHCIDALI